MCELKLTKEEPDKTEADDPKSELVKIDEAAEPSPVVDAICELELAIIEAVFNKVGELKEPSDEDPNDAKEDEPAVVPCEPTALNDESVEKLAAVAVEAGILFAEIPPLEIWPEPEPLERLPVPVPTDSEVPEALVELPCVEPLPGKKPAAVVVEPEVPKLLAELPDTAPRDDAVVAPVGEDWLDSTVVKEKKLLCDAAVDAVV